MPVWYQSSEAQWYVRGIPNVKKLLQKFGIRKNCYRFDGYLCRRLEHKFEWKTESGQSGSI